MLLQDAQEREEYLLCLYGCQFRLVPVGAIGRSCLKLPGSASGGAEKELWVKRRKNYALLRNLWVI